MDKKVRHILGLSGGRDSAALAVYMRDRIPDIEYFFCDTLKELPETYEYLDRLQVYLGKPITRLNATRGFDHWLEIYGGYLPSSRMRWCTRMLKIKPFEEYVGEDETLSYVAIRADEFRDGYISTKKNIQPVYPFKEDGIRLKDVKQILEDAGIGLPDYYSWRTRSGCYFCFFQRKAEWVGLKERHPDLFEQARAYEKIDDATGTRYTWSQAESLDELASPERVAHIKSEHEARMTQQLTRARSAKLSTMFIPADDPEVDDSPFKILSDALDEEDDTEPCLICNL
jgi:3'-phosphoadenosine 5'-phosphosulfate sulfotransferase (PAPS reductase)/FAD synthetase